MATCPICGGRFESARFCPVDGARLEIVTTTRVGQVLGGRYKILAKLGEGGVGEIFDAEHIYLGKRAAVKLLRPQIAADPETVGRLEREARSASAIGHPNIVRVEDFGRTDDLAYLAMELLEGETLDALIARQPPDLATSFEVMAQVCDGLAAAHAAGVIHRDLKPANIFLTRDHHGAYVPKVLDFGIAKLATGDANLTRTGSVVGTPHYMAPEQALGNPVDQRTDIYAAGVILYELVTGEVPFTADSFIAILHKHTADRPRPPVTVAPPGTIPPEVDELILRCLEKEPDRRVPDMEKLGAELRRLAAGDLRAPARAAADPRAPAGAAADPPSPAVAYPAAYPTPSATAETQAIAAQSGDTEDGPAAPRRRPGARTAVAIGLAVAAIAGALAVVALASGGGESAPADAAAGRVATGAPATAADAASAPDPADAGPAPWRHERATEELSYAVSVHPPVPEPRARLDVEVDIDPRSPPLTRALAAGEAEARFRFEYYRDHRTVSEVARDIDESGRVRAILAPPDPGKYHVHLELREREQTLSTFRFDICVGADPRLPESASICPDMNPGR